MINYGFLPLILPFFLTLVLALSACASGASQLLDGRTLLEVPTTTVIQRIQPGTVLILGENHGVAKHRDQHLILLNLIRGQGLKLSVGMEFINYPDQPFLDQYLGGELAEENFLKLIDWKGFSFELYKQQILFPSFANGETTRGLNVPRAITSKIAKTGLLSLTPEERQLLPLDFTLGRDSYKTRFANVMHVPVGPTLDRYFAAQSAWDDTMAEQSAKFMNANPEQVFVIVVGEFHAQYGGGLADRLLARRPDTKILTVSQIQSTKTLDDGSEVPLTQEELQKEVAPSSTEGPRADFIWISTP